MPRFQTIRLAASVTSLLLPLSVFTPRVQAQDSQGARAIQAMEAARQDAYRNLLETVMGLKLRSETTVREMSLESSVTRSAVEGFVRGAIIEDERWREDGSAEVTVRTDLGRLEALLERELVVSLQTLRATGTAAPSPDAVPRSPQRTDPSPPADVEPTEPMDLSNEPAEVPEFNTILTVSGNAAVDPKPGDSDTRARLNAERAAVVDARRNLLEFVYGVHLSSETTVRELCLADDVIRTRVDAFVRGSRVIETTTQGDLSEAIVELDLRDLKDIVR